MSRLLSPVARALSRRAFLRAAGLSLALPMLDAMRPARAAGAADVPRRLVAVETNMGILPQFFFPEKAGRDYALTPYLQRLAKFRGQMTVLSGASHPGATGGHAAENWHRGIGCGGGALAGPRRGRRPAEDIGGAGGRGPEVQPAFFGVTLSLARGSSLRDKDLRG